MACRNLELAEKAAQDIRKTASSDVIVMKLDLANMASIRAFAQEVLNPNVLRVPLLYNFSVTNEFVKKQYKYFRKSASKWDFITCK